MTHPRAAMPGGDEDTSDRPGVPRVLILALFIATLMGRFTLDRVGMPQYTEFDLRIVAIGGLVALTLMWRTFPAVHLHRTRWPASALLALALIGYLALTVFWASLEARAVQTATDLAYLALLIAVTVTISAPNPDQARRAMLNLLWFAGLAYAAAGLLIGQTDEQGRTTAFGGGPNVYVRVVILGLIAGIALCVIHRRALYVLPIPILAVAAVLSGSRGGAVAAVGTALVIGFLCRRRMSRRTLVGGAAVAGGAVLAGALLLGSVAAGAAQQRFIAGLFEHDQFSDRPALLGQGLSIALRAPLIGGGLDSFYAEFGQSEDLTYPHNLIVEIVATGGLIGLGLLVAWAVAFWREGRPWRTLPPDRLAMIATALFIAVAGMFSGDLYDSRFLWVFAALASNAPATWAGPRRPPQLTNLTRKLR